MKLHTALFLALSMGVLSPVHAADMKNTGDMKNMKEHRAEAQYDSARATAKQRYEAARENCRNMAGEEKDACMKSAEAAYRDSKSQAGSDGKSGATRGDSGHDGMKPGYEGTRDSARQQYDAARENCKNLAGHEKDACMKAADAAYSGTGSQASPKNAKSTDKSTDKSGKGRAAADDAGMKADYKAAKERCDKLYGSARDTCENEAKARYQR